MRPEANTAGITNPLQNYNAIGFAYKMDITDQLSAAVVIDEPFGVAVEYIDSPFGVGVGNPSNGRAYIESTAVTAVLRYKLNNGFSVHGGLWGQEISGTVVSSPGSLQAESGYDFGYLLGAAYERPDIALRITATYNSAIDNELSGTEASAASGGIPVAIDDFTVTTPESINLEFQSGVAQDTLVFGSIRHAMWDGFNLTANGSEYVNFSGNTATSSVGVGCRLSDELSVFATLGYEDKGVTPSTTALAPTTGTRSIGLGATYTMGDMEITVGVSYVKLGDQTVNSLAGPVEFADSKAIGVGVRIGYNF